MDTRNSSKNNYSTSEVEKKIANETKQNILYDRFSESSRMHQFFYSNVPPFSTMQREIDKTDCTKSYMAAVEFNKNHPDNVIDLKTIPSCVRLSK